jgi:mannosyltransferase
MFHLFSKDKPLLPSLSRIDLLVLTGGVAAFVALAASTVTKFSIWFDEAFGSFLIRSNFVDLTRYTASDVHPPLYYWLLKLWTMAFGNTELGIRSMSIFFGAVTVVFAFFLVLRLFGRRAAYVSLLFLVLSPMFIRYGQEARMYTLLTAIVVGATYMLVYATETKKRWAWVTYGILVALGMLTQYFAALAWVAHWVWRFVTVRAPKEKFSRTIRKLVDKQWLIAYGTAILLFAFWMPFLVIQFLTIQGYGFWIKPVSVTTVPDFLADFSLFSDAGSVKSWVALGFYFLVVVFVVLIVKVLRTLEGKQRDGYLLMISLVTVPMILLLLMSMPPLRSAFVDRYLLTSVVFLSLLIGATLVLSRRFVGAVATGAIGLVVIALFVTGIINQATIGNYNRSSNQSNNVRQLVEAVRAKAPAGTPILASTPWIFYEAVIYTTPDSPIYFVNETTQYRYGSLTALAEDDTFKIKNVTEFGQRHPDLWVISNLHDTPPKPLRSTWQQKESVVIYDDLTGKPLFQATHFSVE